MCNDHFILLLPCQVAQICLFSSLTNPSSWPYIPEAGCLVGSQSRGIPWPHTAVCFTCFGLYLFGLWFQRLHVCWTVFLPAAPCWCQGCAVGMVQPGRCLSCGRCKSTVVRPEQQSSGARWFPPSLGCDGELTVWTVEFYFIDKECLRGNVFNYLCY